MKVGREVGELLEVPLRLLAPVLELGILPTLLLMLMMIWPAVFYTQTKMMMLRIPPTAVLRATDLKKVMLMLVCALDGMQLTDLSLVPRAMLFVGLRSIRQDRAPTTLR